jgi:threonine dehydratase
MSTPHKNAIEAAEKRIADYIHHTPILSSESIDQMCGASLLFKCENFQKIGAFKMRGASNAIFQLKGDSSIKGITTHSSGNHAQAVALAAKKAGFKAKIVMPSNAPAVKVAAVKGYGAEVALCEPTLQAREDGVEQIIKEDGFAFVHPYDNWEVIYGQATCAKEIYAKEKTLDYLLVPIGGGGLMAGSILSTLTYSPTTKIIGCEPKGADDAYQSWKSGKHIPQSNPQTIADGLKTSVGKINFPIIMENVTEIFTVTDEEIIAAMSIIYERLKIVIEPSCAVPLAVVLANKSYFKGKRLALILTGGNVDLGQLPF